VVDAGVDERLLDPGAVDHDRRVRGVLLDDREQVAEQPPLLRRQLGAVDRRVIIGMLGSPNGWPRSDQRRRPGILLAPVAALRRVRQLLGARGPALQALGRRFALLRYLRPSSYRAVYAL
jgi:hypothetical protein